MKHPLLWFIALVCVTAVALAPTAASATSRRCPGRAAGKYPVVVIRGTTCAVATRAATRYLRSGSAAPWQCALAHAPFRRIAGVKVGASCGYGPRVGGVGLTSRRHAFAIGAG